MFAVQARHTVAVRNVVNPANMVRRAMVCIKQEEGLARSQNHHCVTMEEVVIDSAKAGPWAFI